MSSSFPSMLARLLAPVASVVAVLLVSGGRAQAAEVFIQPQATVQVESSSNAGLNPDSASASSSESAIADLMATFGIATPRSTTTFRPRVKLSEDSERDIEPVDTFVDLRTDFRTERGTLDFLARYDRRDTYRAELPDGEFDDLVPDDPTTPETGNNRVGEVRERFEVSPGYNYQLTERVRLGADALFQTIRYTGEASADLTDYDYWLAGTYLAYAVGARTDLRAGAYVSEYEAKNEFEQIEAIGGSIGLEHEWSESAFLAFDLVYERNDIDSESGEPTVRETGWGGTVTALWKGEVRDWRVVAGRTFTPNGRGGKSTSDQIRVQYDRRVSERLAFRSALRLLSDESIDELNVSGDRDYGRLELSLNWMFTPTWFVFGGYHFTYQERASDPDSADDHKFFVGVGYRGLGQRS